MYRRLLVCLILSLSLTSLVSADLIQNAKAATMNVSVANGSVTLNYSLKLVENMTVFCCAPPQFQAALIGTNASGLKQSLTAAVQRLVPGAWVDQVTLQASGTNASSGFWTLSENYTIVVLGASTSKGGIVRADLALLRLNMSNPLMLDGMELNRVGTAYLLPPLLGFASGVVAPEQARYYDSGSVFLNSVVPGNDTRRFRILDFSWLPLFDGWTHDYDPFSLSSVWNFPSHAQYNLTYGRLTPEQTIAPAYVAYYSPSLEMIAPARASIQGDMLSYDVGSVLDTLMPLSVLASISILVVTFLLNRRLSARVKFRKKK